MQTVSAHKVSVLNELKSKVHSITYDCSKPYFQRALERMIETNPENCNTICEYILAEQSEINLKDSTKEGKIKVLMWLSAFLGGKRFRRATKQDILSYLDSLRRPLSEDANRKWIGSYNSRQMILNKFFRWLYNPDECDQKKRITPPCMTGVRKLPRGQSSPYKPSDLWDSCEHSIFLKYCPSKRDRCYHAMANDMSARPHEILNLKINDIHFKTTEEGTQYAEVLITGGKTKPRTLPLIESIPYVKDWIDSHPTTGNPESWLFVSMSKNTYGSRLSYDGLSGHYKYYYKDNYFPRLLHDATVPEADKSFIRNMLTKPWNLYIFRHSALTEKSLILKEAVLRDHAGWSNSSRMPQVYIHYFGTESSRSLLQAKGIMKAYSSTMNIMKSKQCPNCNEPNKPDSKFCSKCRMVLTYDAYNETLEGQKKSTDKLTKIEERFDLLQNQLQILFEILKGTADPEAHTLLAEHLAKAGLIQTTISATKING
jgi:integrase